MPTPVVTEGIAIELVVDASGSMRETDLNWNGAVISRFEAVQRAFRLFVLGGTAPDGAVFSGRSQDLIGLVTFATYPDSPAPLTLSHRVLADLLDAEQPRPLNEAQTNIGDALAEALVRLEEAGTRRKVIVLLTDGEHNFAGTDRAPSRTPRWAARRAADLGVAIYAIDAGSDAGGSTPEMRQAGRAALQEVASISGGGYFAVQDAAALLRVCHEIDRLETRPIVSPFRSPYRELHVPFGLAALCFILAAQAWNLMIGGQAR
jgi:Ca-activated chloride channel family protein